MSKQTSSGAGSRGGSQAATARRLRLQRILADAGIASRRAAERFLREGRVEVNGRVASLGDSADPDRDLVRVDGRAIESQPKRYWLLNKPLDVLTTTRDPQGRRTVIDLLPAAAGRVVPVGRLDRDTEGLLLLTNDGPLIQRLLHPSHGNEREYRVTLSGEVDAVSARRVERGVPLEDGKTARARVTRRRYDARAGTTTLHLTLIEGKKRQIRRLFGALGHRVRRLVRVRMGPLVLGRLPAGQARELRADERRALLRHAQALAARVERGSS